MNQHKWDNTKGVISKCVRCGTIRKRTTGAVYMLPDGTLKTQAGDCDEIFKTLNKKI